MKPELVILQGDDTLTDEEKYIIANNPELMGAWITTAVTVGTGIAKYGGKIFKKLGIGKKIRAKRRSRVEKWKRKILAERKKKRARALEQLQFRMQQVKRMNPPQRKIGQMSIGGLNQKQIMIGAGIAFAAIMFAMKD